MDLQTLRDQVRELLSESSANLSDAVLNDLIERATQRIESDYTSDYGAVPRQMVSSVSGTITDTGYPLPADYLRPRSVSIGDSTLRYVAPELMPQTSQQVDATVSIVYYKRLDKLVNDTDTNWLLDIASRVYVYGTAVEYTMWNRESFQDRDAYANVYTESRKQTGRSNSPRSAGGWQRAKGNQQGSYSIVGENMIFGYTY